MTDGRKKNGGKRSNSGRRSKAEELGLQALLDKCISDAERKKLFRKLHALGMKGNVPAAQLLLGYIYGKPKEQHDNTGEVTLRIVRGKGNNNKSA